MRKHTVRKRLQQIVQLMLLQYCIILFFILCVATFYGIRTDRWLEAAETAEILAAVLTLFMPVAYWRIRNLVKAYYDGPPSLAAETIVPAEAENPVPSEHTVVGPVIDMPYAGQL